MAATTNGNGNIVDEFEESFQVNKSFTTIPMCANNGTLYLTYIIIFLELCIIDADICMIFLGLPKRAD